jgi:hypothetical protein
MFHLTSVPPASNLVTPLCLPHYGSDVVIIGSDSDKDSFWFSPSIGQSFECREWGKRHCLSQSKGHDHKWSDSRSCAFAASLCCSVPGRTFFTARANHSSFQSSLLKVKTLRVTAASQHTPSTKNGVITPVPFANTRFIHLKIIHWFAST